MQAFQITVSENTKYEIQLTAILCGKDLSVTICGGTLHHVGAAALACGCMPDGSSLKYSATVSTLTVLDHKDDAVARAAAIKLADYIHGVVTVTAGIHIDDASPGELKILQNNCMEACNRLIKKIP